MPFASVFSAIAGHVELWISQGGYVFLFLITIAEGIPVIGMAVPGHISVIASGFLAKLGTLELLPVIMIASIGAITGDCIGYYIGRKYGMSFIDRLRPYFFITDEHIDRARQLLGKHTGKSLIFGRFAPPTRPLMPFLVGTMHTPSGRFWFFNIVGGIIWAVSSVMLGYIFGAGYSYIAHIFGRVIVITVLFAVIVVWGYRMVNSYFHIFRKYELITLALNLVSLAVLAITIDELMDQSFRLGLDVWVSQFMCNAVHVTGTCLAVVTPESPLTSIGAMIVFLATAVSLVGGTAVTGGLGMMIGLWFAWLRKWRSAAIMILSVGATAGIVGTLKQLFMGLRPPNALEILVNDPGFPSGHSSMAAAFFTALAYLLAPRINSRVKRELMIVGCVLAVFLIGLSRLVLNVHWLSDVVAGWSVGIFVATAAILLVRYAGGFFQRK